MPAARAGLGTVPRSTAPRRHQGASRHATEKTDRLANDELVPDNARAERAERAEREARRVARRLQREEMAIRVSFAVIAPEHRRLFVLRQSLARWHVRTKSVHRALVPAAETPRRGIPGRDLLGPDVFLLARVQARVRGNQQRRRFAHVLRAELALLRAECEDAAAAGVESQAAVAVQAGWRGCLARRRCKQLARRRREEMQRTLAELNLELEIYNAAIEAAQNVYSGTVQRCWRGHAARKQSAALARARDLDRRIAVNCQRHARGCSARRAVARMHRAATVIEACRRGQSGRRAGRHAAHLLSLDREDTRLRAKNAAALFIQRVHRGRSVRVRLRKELEGAILLQSLCRSWLQHVELYEQLWETTATTIQSWWRGMATRERILVAIRGELEDLEAAALLQALVLGKVTKDAFVERRLMLSVAAQAAMATKLQKVWRGIRGRWQFETHIHEDNAAQTIQMIWRERSQSKKIYAEALLMAQSVIRIQSVYRGRLARREKHYGFAQTQCVARLQAWWRGHSARQRYMDDVMQDLAAQMIQGYWKNRLEEREHQQTIDSERAKLRTSFDAVDTDGGGTLDTEEVGQLVSAHALHTTAQ